MSYARLEYYANNDIRYNSLNMSTRMVYRKPCDFEQVRRQGHPMIPRQSLSQVALSLPTHKVKHAAADADKHPLPLRSVPVEENGPLLSPRAHNGGPPTLLAAHGTVNFAAVRILLPLRLSQE